LVIVVITFEIINIINNVYQIKLKTKRIEGSLVSERKLLEKLNLSNDHLKEIIHDLKAPITSLNFCLQSLPIDKDKLILISKRFDRIYENLAMDSSNPIANWYSIQTLIVHLEEVCLEMGGIFQKFNLNKPENMDGMVYFFVEDFKNALSEVLMNSYKAASKKAIVSEASITIQNLDKEVKIFIQDKSGGVSEHFLNNLSERGVTTGNSGLGLWMVKKRLSEVQGELSFANKEGGLEVCFKYMKKSRL
jgi:signal transduction histidine kinase